jgi:hypothetical protein
MLNLVVVTCSDDIYFIVFTFTQRSLQLPATNAVYRHRDSSKTVERCLHLWAVPQVIKLLIAEVHVQYQGSQNRCVVDKMEMRLMSSLPLVSAVMLHIHLSRREGLTDPFEAAL